jgi:cob(I)alamin adenosyltransferase
MKIYTKTGDEGETSLFGGKRVGKDHLRIEAYGTVDELNSVLGIAHCEIKNDDIKQALNLIQHDLFVVGADLASPADSANSLNKMRIEEAKVEWVELQIDKFENLLPDLKHFILPGGTKGAAYLHLARTVCRRAERKVFTLGKSIDIGSNILVYLNRLSDLFFVLARYENKFNETPDVKWKK